MDKNKTYECYGCSHLCNSLGNYIECGLYAEKHSNELGHMFVDQFYWNIGSPEKCPLKETEGYADEHLTEEQKKELLSKGISI